MSIDALGQKSDVLCVYKFVDCIQVNLVNVFVVFIAFIYSFFFYSLRMPPDRLIGDGVQPGDGSMPVQRRRRRPHVQPLRQRLSAEPLADRPLRQ